MAQLTEARLFELLGRIWAELRVVTEERDQLQQVLMQKEPQKAKKGG